MMKGSKSWLWMLVVWGLGALPLSGWAQAVTTKSSDPVGSWEWVWNENEMGGYRTTVLGGSFVRRTLIMRADSTLLFSGMQAEGADTFSWTAKRVWGRLSGDTLWVDSRGTGSRIVMRDGYLRWGTGLVDGYKRVDVLAPIVNRFHPRPAQATGTMAQLVGTWERVSGKYDNPDMVSRTISFRPDSTWVEVQLHKSGADTLSLTQVGHGRATGDTLWMHSNGPKWDSLGTKILLQGEQFSTFRWDSLVEPINVYRRVKKP